jgi:hypothetical protein
MTRSSAPSGSKRAIPPPAPVATSTAPSASTARPSASPLSVFAKRSVPLRHTTPVS